MIDPLVGRIIAFGLGLLLLSAAWHKMSARAEFTAALQGYELLPAPLLRLVAALLPAVEAVLGLCWLAGGAARVPVAIATAMLLLAYAAAIAVNLRRGRNQIDCGCGFGGPAGNQRISGWLVARNLVLAGVALVAALPAGARALGPADALAAAAATATAVLLYAGASQLIRNAALYAGRRAPRG